MKKILSLLSTLAVIGGSTLTVMSCKGRAPNEIYVQANTKWVPMYKKAAEVVNNSFKERGYDWKIKLKEIDFFQEKDLIDQRGVRDKGISDIFTFPLDQYPKYVNQNTLKDLTEYIKNDLVKTEEDSKRFGLKIDKSKQGIEGIQVIDNVNTWSSALVNNLEGKSIYGTIPMSVENLLWVFNKDRIGIEKVEHEGNSFNYLVGSEVDKVNNLDKWEGENIPQQAKGKPKASIENLAKLNLNQENDYKFEDDQVKEDTKKGAPLVHMDAGNGYRGGTFLNSILSNRQDEINELKADSSTPGMVWIKKGKKANTTEKTDFDSIWENKKFEADFNEVTDTIVDFVKSLGKHIETIYGGASGQISQIIDDALKDGTTAMTLIGPWEVASKLEIMKKATKNANSKNYGFASIGDITFGSQNWKLTGFAGGFGRGVKSTIANRVSKSEKDGSELSKTQAAVEFINEISKKEYATELAFADGKISAYKQVADNLVKELKEGTNVAPVSEGRTEEDVDAEKANRKLIGEAYEGIISGYGKTGKNAHVAPRANNEVFVLYWGSYSTAFGSTFNKEQNKDNQKFHQIFRDTYKQEKERYKFH